MLVSRDVYEHITNFVNDRTLLKMMSVNKKFNSDESYKRLLLRKYPHLINFKKNDEKFKYLFIRMTKYINKLSNKFQFPYIPSPEFDPYDFYMEITNNDTLKEESDDESSFKSWEDRIDEWFSDDNPLRDMWNEGLRYTCHTTDEKLVQYMLDKGAYWMFPALNNAAHRGNEKIVQYLLKLDMKKVLTSEAWDFNAALSSACSGGQLNMARFFIDKGANNLAEALLQAGYSDNMDLIQYLIAQGAPLDKFKEKYHFYFPLLYDLEIISEDEYLDYICEYEDSDDEMNNSI